MIPNNGKCKVCNISLKTMAYTFYLVFNTQRERERHRGEVLLLALADSTI
jgi:hypothetical protein